MHVYLGSWTTNFAKSQIHNCTWNFGLEILWTWIVGFVYSPVLLLLCNFCSRYISSFRLTDSFRPHLLMISNYNSIHISHQYEQLSWSRSRNTCGSRFWSPKITGRKLQQHLHCKRRWRAGPTNRTPTPPTHSPKLPDKRGPVCPAARPATRGLESSVHRKPRGASVSCGTRVFASVSGKIRECCTL